MKKRFLLSILLSFLILIAACSIPLRLPVPAGDSISVFYGTGEEECHYLLEPGTEAYERVCYLLGDLRFHLSPRAGIQLTPSQKEVKNNQYAIIGYYGKTKGNVICFVSSRGFLQYLNHSFAIGQYGDNKAAIWLEAMQLALEDVEPDSKEVMITETNIPIFVPPRAENIKYNVTNLDNNHRAKEVTCIIDGDELQIREHPKFCVNP